MSLESPESAIQGRVETSKEERLQSTVDEGLTRLVAHRTSPVESGSNAMELSKPEMKEAACGGLPATEQPVGLQRALDLRSATLRQFAVDTTNVLVLNDDAFVDVFLLAIAHYDRMADMAGKLAEVCRWLSVSKRVRHLLMEEFNLTTPLNVLLFCYGAIGAESYVRLFLGTHPSTGERLYDALLCDPAVCIVHGDIVEIGRAIQAMHVPQAGHAPRAPQAPQMAAQPAAQLPPHSAPLTPERRRAVYDALRPHALHVGLAHTLLTRVLPVVDGLAALHDHNMTRILALAAVVQPLHFVTLCGARLAESPLQMLGPASSLVKPPPRITVASVLAPYDDAPYKVVSPTATSFRLAALANSCSLSSVCLGDVDDVLQYLVTADAQGFGRDRPGTSTPAPATVHGFNTSYRGLRFAMHMDGYQVTRLPLLYFALDYSVHRDIEHVRRWVYASWPVAKESPRWESSPMAASMYHDTKWIHHYAYWSHLRVRGAAESPVDKSQLKVRQDLLQLVYYDLLHTRYQLDSAVGSQLLAPPAGMLVHSVSPPVPTLSHWRVPKERPLGPPVPSVRHGPEAPGAPFTVYVQEVVASVRHFATGPFVEWVYEDGSTLPWVPMRTLADYHFWMDQLELVACAPMLLRRAYYGVTPGVRAPQRIAAHYLANATKIGTRSDTDDIYESVCEFYHRTRLDHKLQLRAELIRYKTLFHRMSLKLADRERWIARKERKLEERRRRAQAVETAYGAHSVEAVHAVHAPVAPQAPQALQALAQERRAAQICRDRLRVLLDDIGAVYVDYQRCRCDMKTNVARSDRTTTGVVSTAAETNLPDGGWEADNVVKRPRLV